MNRIINLIKSVIENLLYVVFLSIYLAFRGLEWLLRFRFFPQSIGRGVRRFADSFLNSFNVLFPNRNKNEISQLDLVEMSLKTLAFKKSRTLVTVGGMAIGIGVIVLLVSIGYGLQDYVVTQVSTFEGLKQIDVAPQVGNKVSLNAQAVSNFKEVSGVEKVLPIISLIAQVSYAGSESTVAAYGVDSDYLTTSELKPTQGNIFQTGSGSTNVLKVPVSYVQTDVLGVSEDIQSDSSNGSLEFVTLPQAEKPKDDTKIIPLADDIQKEIVINSEMAKLLGLNEADTIGKTISITFRVPSELLPPDGQVIQTNKVNYEITGVVSEGNTPILYFPIANLDNLPLESYSSARVIVTDQSQVPNARSKIGAMGFGTISVMDTINQIQTLFNNVRLLLTILGLIALVVAALGVFNTLTVSLLERTKEVGLLKAMGMNSSEVKELFLTESLLLALSGCFAGIALGFISGKILSIVVSIIVLPTGAGWLDITSIPLSLVFLVILLSVIVGLIIGLYPSRRAKKISALDALRYE